MASKPAGFQDPEERIEQIEQEVRGRPLGDPVGEPLGADTAEGSETTVPHPAPEPDELPINQPAQTATIEQRGAVMAATAEDEATATRIAGIVLTALTKKREQDEAAALAAREEQDQRAAGVLIAALTGTPVAGGNTPAVVPADSPSAKIEARARELFALNLNMATIGQIIRDEFRGVDNSVQIAAVKAALPKEA